MHYIVEKSIFDFVKRQIESMASSKTGRYSEMPREKCKEGMAKKERGKEGKEGGRKEERKRLKKSLNADHKGPCVMLRILDLTLHVMGSLQEYLAGK